MNVLSAGPESRTDRPASAVLLCGHAIDAHSGPVRFMAIITPRPGG